MSLSQNQIVRAFTLTKHRLSHNEQLYKISKVKDQLRKRHERAKKNQEKKKNSAKHRVNSNTPEERLKEITEHTMTHQQLASKYQVKFETGLTEANVDAKLSEFGHNSIKGKKEESKVLLFLLQMADPFSLFMWLLIVLSLVAYGLSEPKDSNPLFLSIIIFITIITGAIVSFEFIKDSQELIKKFKDILPSYANVKRDGIIKMVRSEEIVPGDVLVIGPGEKIPADVRVIEAHQMFASKTIFTGESDKREVKVECTNRNNPFESKNILFSGQICERGNGTAVVFGTGESTLLANLSHFIEESPVKETNIQVQIARFVKIVTIFAITIGVVVLIAGGLIGYDWLIAAMIAIGVCLASAPTVLNLVIIIMLTISVKKLADQEIICKKLSVIESLGSTSCLLLDKTGTLTQSEVSVNCLSYNLSCKQGLSIRKNSVNTDTVFQEMLKCAVLSSSALFKVESVNSEVERVEIMSDLHENKVYHPQKQEEQIKTLGDTIESALIRYFNQYQDIKTVREKFPLDMETGRESLCAYDTQKKFSYCIVRERSMDMLYIKGSPSVIWALTSRMQVGDQIRKKDAELSDYFSSQLQRFGSRGEKTIALAKKVLKTQTSAQSLKFIDEKQIISDLTFLGLISMKDPIKKGIDSSILRVKAAGIKVVMVTGDNSITSLCVARQCNIIQEPKTANELMRDSHISWDRALKISEAVQITGDTLFQLEIEDQALTASEKGKSLENLLKKRQVIFTETNPSQKLHIMQALQKMGYIVCAIGDGVNDSPIVKYSDAGISMGSGADATKEAADIIFVNNDINLIVFGIEEGRKIFDNLKKSICYVMTSQMSEWLPFVVLLIFRIPIPVFTLLIDGTADFVPAISFAFENGELGLMTRKPRNQNEHLVSYKLLAQCSGWMGFGSFLCSLTCFYICMNDFGFEVGHLWYKNNIPILVPDSKDVFNPSTPYFGNSKLVNIPTCNEFYEQVVGIDWINSLHPSVDLRMAALECSMQNEKPVFTQNLVFKHCHVQQISRITLKPVCFTTEAAKYGQTAYMYANVVNQVFNLFICKTRRESCFTQKMDNYIIYMGITFEIMLSLALNETIFMVQLIGTRDTIYMHYGLAAIPFGIVQLLLDEARKYLIRNLPEQSQSTDDKVQKVPNWFERYFLW